ncbi:type II toxin-antitoxin system Phd/YefM family antitoxin [Spirochaeta lutea]|uniref:Antitoxin n=1 Tax=Spirochaeta lutea TaxID=1480694 RepID=A0A098R3Y1_9SPIO|nr:type II toxin-antitoxin system Phd/YefM family antitoxin [Spirochaeta lutea]KGE73442.1 prevent-host-death family protein [Spirochaeta lutea]
MKTLPVGEFKTHFSDILKEVQSGEEVIITYGRNKKGVAALIPISEYKQQNTIKIGLLKDQQYSISEDFEMTEEEFIGI